MTRRHVRFSELVAVARQAPVPGLDVTGSVMHSVVTRRRSETESRTLFVAATLSLCAAAAVGVMVWWCDALVRDPLLEFVTPWLALVP